MLQYLMYQAARGNVQSSPGGISLKHGLEILPDPYPKSFTDFVGQNRARQMILANVNSALLQTQAAGHRVPMGHTLLASGIAGVGKSSLARLAAYTYGGGFAEIGGLVNDRDAAKVIKQMHDGDCLFIDEMHRLFSRGKARGEWLLTLMQDGCIQTATGVVTAPKITIIGATTDPQKLPETVLDRFPVKPMIEAYTPSEALKIARTTAARLGYGRGDLNLPMPSSEGWLAKVAMASDNNPRRIGQLLSNVMDVALSTALANYSDDGGYDIALALDWNGLTPDGLTKSQQDYMVALHLYGGHAGIGTLRAVLNESDLGYTEKGLIQKGYTIVTAKGRELTDMGLERAQQLAVDQLKAARQKETA